MTRVWRGSFDFNGKRYQVHVTKVFPEVQAGSSQVDMDFASGSTPSGIRRGQTLQIKLNLDNSSQALLLPKGGFFQSTSGSWVFVVDKSGSFANIDRLELK